ncbi:MAG: type II CRISPR-associated endonuclease Cas1 [Turicibacter sp.]|nr:type II CRISPR-associated endonuclease Cas1 [Turicibacter sp.]
MGFRTIVVGEHCKLSYQNNHLIYRTSHKKEVIFLPEIDLLFLETADISITTMLLSKLISENVGVIFCDEKRLPASQLVPYYGRHDTTLQIQKQMSWEGAVKDQAWVEVLQQKIRNQGNLLYRFLFLEKGESIHGLLKGLEPKDPSNREGHAARILFNTLYGNAFNREQENDINAGLNYGYTLVLSLFAREISKCGCLTQLGVNHTNQFNDFNLASDLMEPFRVLVDEIVYEHRSHAFPIIKRHLFSLFTKTYPFGGADMFLTNIIGQYTRQAVDFLNGSRTSMPVFTYS